MIAGFVEFEFDLPEALLSSLVSVFNRTASARLLAQNVQAIPEAQGVYQLTLNGSVVYVGKTDSEAGLRHRLERHSRTIQHRLNLKPEEVGFKAVRVFVFTAMDLETQLIRHYVEQGNPTGWNNSGFGSNDPGRERDTTNIKPESFDALYPIDVDRELPISLAANPSARAVVDAVKDRLPYTFRVESQSRRSKQLHPDFSNLHVTLPEGQLTTRSILTALVSALPTGWQATALAGRVILYKERRDYPSGTVIAQS